MAMMTCYSSSLVLVLLCFYHISFLKALGDGFSVEIIHRDSTKSPLYNPKETHFQRVSNALHRSINRVNHFNQYSVSQNTPKSTITPGQGEYQMSYSIGTPPFKVLGFLDTGSGLNWLQCEPCKHCYKQTAPIFNPSKSKTYKTLPCSSKPCQSLQFTSPCSSNKNMCEYSAYYADGSISKGDLIVETLTLDSTNGSSVQFPKTVIGCGHNNNGTFKEKGSGIVALGSGPLSLISQLNSSIGGKFSYCLTPMFSKSKDNSSGKLNFGDAAVVSGNGTVSTPLIVDSLIGYYYLTIEALSVGHKRIDFGSFGPSNEKLNMIIDSGTTLTIFPQFIYSKLESAVKESIHLERVEDPENFFSLCYISESDIDKLSVPVITVHFTGADVKLNPINTFIEVAKGIVCLAFHSNDDTTPVFGNLAQQNILVGYDVIKRTLSFKAADCTKV